MKLFEKKKNVQFFGLNKEGVVLQYIDHLDVNNSSIKIEASDEFSVWNGILYLKRNKNRYMYASGSFVPCIQGRFGQCTLGSMTDSYYKNNNIYHFSVFHDGVEYIIKLESRDVISLEYKFVGMKEDVMIFEINLDKGLLFCSKTGERLWEYKTKSQDWKINRMCIPIVDNIIAIISENTRDHEDIVRVEGYDIQTGENLWKIESADVTCHLIVGEDKMLYACNVRWYVGEDNHTELRLTVINPFTGVFENHVLKHHDEDVCVMSWNTCIYGNKLYYADNRPGCILGVVDLDKKQIVDEFSLNLKKGFTMGAPIVTEDKIYQFIRNKKEVWVFDK